MKIGPIVIGKDGGADSTVDGVMFEIKSLFSVGLLRFKNGSREAFHSHAFNCWSVLLKGTLIERFLGGPERVYFSGACITTKRSDVHKVSSYGTSYVLTFRGPWKRTWVDAHELPSGRWAVHTLSDGRVTNDLKTFDTKREAADYVRRTQHDLS